MFQSEQRNTYIISALKCHISTDTPQKSRHEYNTHTPRANNTWAQRTKIQQKPIHEHNTQTPNTNQHMKFCKYQGKTKNHSCVFWLTSVTLPEKKEK